MTANQVTFSFLTTGPTMRVGLDGSFRQFPQLTSPVYIRDSHGARSFYFIPAFADSGMRDLERVSSLTDRDGKEVAVYARDMPPPQWWLRWSLANGYVYTFLEEEDGLAYAQTVATAIGMDDSVSGLPFLLPNPPIRVAAAPEIGFGEHAHFSSPTGPVVAVRRPGFLEEGRIMVNDVGDSVSIRAGVALGCEIKVVDRSLEGARALLETAMDGFEG